MVTVGDLDVNINSVSVDDETRFELLREEFNRLATDTLAERYDVSPNFINEDGSFSRTARETVLVENNVDLVTVVGNLQQLRGTKEAQQLEELGEDSIATAAGSEVGGLPFDAAREYQEERLEELRQQSRQAGRSRRSKTTPKLQEVDADETVVRELAPSFVGRFNGTLPFDSDSTQLQDGQTVTDQNGDQNIRLNMEMVLTAPQLFKLQQMRVSGNQLKLISVAYKGKATFDEIKFDHIPDDNGRITAGGDSIQDATFVVQLQSKESDEDDDSLIQPFTED